MAKHKPPRASFWLKVKRALGLAEPQRTCVWCSRCGNEMCSDPNTKHTYRDNGLLEYDCGECHARSLWDFDAPVPLLIKKLSDRRSEIRA